MKSLITGINGFVGAHLKGHLLEKGFEVHGTDISSGKNVDYVLDITDQQAVNKMMLRLNPDYIFHLAAQSSVKLSFTKPELTMNINVNGTKNLLDSIKKNFPGARILIVSSADIYGQPKKLPLTEDSELNPVSPYGESRLKQEKLALGYNLNCVIVRSFPHTGPGQNQSFVASDIAKQVADIEKGNKPIIYTGDISIKRDFTDVRDIVKAYLLALEKCSFNEPYNICSCASYSINEIIKIILGFTDISPLLKQDKSKLRKIDIKEMRGDSSKFQKATAWQPEIPLQQTLKDLLDYWRNKR